MKLADLAALNAERAARRACALVTDVASGMQRFVRAQDVDDDPIGDLVAERLRAGKSAMVQHEGRDYFITAQVPPARVFVIGAVHVSQALAPMAKIAGYDVTIIDPRTAFASQDRFKGFTIHAEWPQDVLPKIGLDPYTAVVALAHVGHIDDEALKLAVKANCLYVGALGSSRNHAKRRERLKAAGFTDAEMTRIKSPIGLSINAQSPAEIALSVMAEVVSYVRGPKAVPQSEVAAE